jgi:hypothetical protein
MGLSVGYGLLTVVNGPIGTASVAQAGIWIVSVSQDDSITIEVHTNKCLVGCSRLVQCLSSALRTLHGTSRK